MAFRAVLTVSTVVLVGSVLYELYQKNAEKKLRLSFEHNVDATRCILCLGNDPPCSSLSFRLDVERHAELGQHSDVFRSFLFRFMRFLNFWSNQPDDKIFFGTLASNDGAEVSVVGKSPGIYYSKMFERMVTNMSFDDHTRIPDGSWTPLPFSDDIRSLVLCSNDETESNYLHYNFLSSAVKNSYNSQSLTEAWTASHLSVELLVLKVLNGYQYVPDVYYTCGQVYFVEDCGRTLRYHLNSMTLSNRLLVAKELIILALELTNGSAHSNYSFYLTDLTADNIAIKLDKTSEMFLSLKVIDWSDVIIVSNNYSVAVNNNEPNNNPHTSDHIDCGIGCLTYSVKDICQASFSDHNIYAVCKEFLSGDLLHEITEFKNGNKALKTTINLLRSLVNECLWHTNTRSFRNSRFDIAKSILTTVQQLVDMV